MTIESEWPSESTGPLLTRLRRRLFGLSGAEIATRQRLFAEMQERTRREMALDDADDELRIIQDYSDEQVIDLRVAIAALPDAAAKLALLRERFGEDAERIWPLYSDESVASWFARKHGVYDGGRDPVGWVYVTPQNEISARLRDINVYVNLSATEPRWEATDGRVIGFSFNPNGAIENCLEKAGASRT
jgi:hypothetical protein